MSYVYRFSTFLPDGAWKFHLLSGSRKKKGQISPFSFCKRNGSETLELWSDESVQITGVEFGLSLRESELDKHKDNGSMRGKNGRRIKSFN